MIQVFAQHTITPQEEQRAREEMLERLKLEELARKLAFDIPTEAERVRERILALMSDGRERTTGDVAYKLAPHKRERIVGVLRYLCDTGALNRERHVDGQCMIYSLAAE